MKKVIESNPHEEVIPCNTSFVGALMLGNNKHSK